MVITVAYFFITIGLGILFAMKSKEYAIEKSSFSGFIFRKIELKIYKTSDNKFFLNFSCESLQLSYSSFAVQRVQNAGKELSSFFETNSSPITSTGFRDNLCENTLILEINLLIMKLFLCYIGSFVLVKTKNTKLPFMHFLAF